MRVLLRWFPGCCLLAEPLLCWFPGCSRPLLRWVTLQGKAEVQDLSFPAVFSQHWDTVTPLLILIIKDLVNLKCYPPDYCYGISLLDLSLLLLIPFRLLIYPPLIYHSFLGWVFFSPLICKVLNVDSDGNLTGSIDKV